MKPNELRIGNLIMDRGYKEWQIDHWETRNKVASNNTTTMCNGIMIETHPLTEYVDFLKPIPLTEEKLLKFGAIKINNKEYTFKGYILSFDTNNRLWILQNGCCQQEVVSGDIQYVHRFQNIIFELTDAEITYDI